MRVGIGTREGLDVDEVLAAARAAGERVFVLAQSITDYALFRREHELDHHHACYVNGVHVLHLVQVRHWVVTDGARFRHDSPALFATLRANLANLGDQGA